MNDVWSYGAIIALALIIALRGWRIAMRNRKKYLNRQPAYKRRDFTRTGNPRRDDGDIPSGFGGLGGLGGFAAIKPEDVRPPESAGPEQNNPEEP